MYVEPYLQRKASINKIFKKLEMSLRKSWQPIKKLRPRTATGPENGFAVLGMVENDPHVIQKTVASATVCVSVASVNSILKVNKFHPYLTWPDLVQELKPADYGQRSALCNFLMLIKIFLKFQINWRF